MIQPFVNLILGLILILFVVIVFLPKFGLISLIKKLRVDHRKIQLEDTLKYLYESEYEKLTISANDLSANLNLNSENLLELIRKLEHMKLIGFSGEKIELTTTGREYALRIIRTHRIWEKYLAEETSINEVEWHTEAEAKEHFMTDREVEIINDKIGNPLFDPHGDPIPSKDGSLPPLRGVLLSELLEGDYAKVIHLEDEPTEKYRKIVSLNISIGSLLKILKITNSQVQIELNHSKILLPIEIINNITVEKTEAKTNDISKAIRLSDLKKSEKAFVVTILKSCRGQQRRRLLDFGIVPGSKITTEIESVGNDPRGYKVRGTIVALRNDTARLILVEKE